MLRQTLLVLALAVCVLGSTLPLRRLPHSGPARRFAVSRGRIYGGHDAIRGEIPYVVSLHHQTHGFNIHICGGSIISTNAVLTAAHCKTILGYLYAVAGACNMRNDEDIMQSIPVSDQIIHPDFSGETGPNDIAVFILQSPLSLGTYVQTIILPSAGSIPEGGSTAVVSGWGSTETDIEPDNLQTVEVSIIDYETCRQNLDDVLISDNPLTDTMICTGPLYDGISPCSFDDGGPLAQNGELIGVVSWGISPCASPGAPFMYTRVSAHLDFINQNI